MVFLLSLTECEKRRIFVFRICQALLRAAKIFVSSGFGDVPENASGYTLALLATSITGKRASGELAFLGVHQQSRECQLQQQVIQALRNRDSAGHSDLVAARWTDAGDFVPENLPGSILIPATAHLYTGCLRHPYVHAVWRRSLASLSLRTRFHLARFCRYPRLSLGAASRPQCVGTTGRAAACGCVEGARFSRMNAKFFSAFRYASHHIPPAPRPPP